MSLRCSFKGCVTSCEIARGDQLAFYQDINNGGWNLGLGPEYKVSQSSLPPSIRLVDCGDIRSPYQVHCSRCNAKLGKVMKVAGFEEFSVNFSATKVVLVQTRNSTPSSSTSSKWSKVVGLYPGIRQLKASIPQCAPLVGSNTVHFHGATDLHDMIQSGKEVATRSNLNPRRYQWRAYFFSCLNNVLLCLPTGMGKTLIANMLMKAYQQRNPDKGQVFVVPTIVLVSVTN